MRKVVGDKERRRDEKKRRSLSTEEGKKEKKTVALRRPATPRREDVLPDHLPETVKMRGKPDVVLARGETTGERKGALLFEPRDGQRGS